MHIPTILAQHSPTRILNADTGIFIYPCLQAYIKTIRASVLIRVVPCVVSTDGNTIALLLVNSCQDLRTIVMSVGASPE